MPATSDEAEATLKRVWKLEEQQHFEEAKTLLEPLSSFPDPTIRADATYALGRIARLRGDYDLALARYGEARAIVRDHVPQDVAETMLGSVLHAEAGVLLQLRRFEEARARLEEAIAYRIATRDAEDYWLSYPLCDLARVALAADELAAAVRSAAERALAHILRARQRERLTEKMRRTLTLHGALMLSLVARTHWWEGDEARLFERSDECCALLGELVAEGLVLVPCTWATIVETELPGRELADCAVMLAGAAASTDSPVVRERARFRCARFVRLLERDCALHDLREAWLAVSWRLRRAWGQKQSAAAARSALLAEGILPIEPDPYQPRWDPSEDIEWQELWGAVIELERQSLNRLGVPTEPSWTAWAEPRLAPSSLASCESALDRSGV